MQSAPAINLSIDDIMSAILPENDQDEIPTGFSIVGHVGKTVFTLIMIIK